MGASEQGGGQRRLRSNTWLAVGIATAAILVLAWIAWAIHIAADKGGREALGVLIAWPAIAVALAIVSLPIIWALRRPRRRPDDSAAVSDRSSSSEDARAPFAG